MSTRLRSVAAADPYAVLEVAPTADLEEIRRAYRRLARSLHPDLNPDGATEDRFSAVALAYETLADPERRAEVDREAAEVAAFLATRPAARPRVVTGRPRSVLLRLTPEQAYDGGVREVSVSRHQGCVRCRETGLAPGGTVVACATCEGSGHRMHVQHTLTGTVRTWRSCRDCHGYGGTYSAACPDCAGSGQILGVTVLRVGVPPGVSDGQVLRVDGAGDSGVAGGGAGELYLDVVVGR